MSVLIYSKPNCPFCDKAYDLLKKEGYLEFVSFSVGESISKEDFIKDVENRAGITPKTVPQIFIDGEHIGGYDDLVVHFEDRNSNDEDIDLSELSLD